MNEKDIQFDQQHIWHPYTSMPQSSAVFPVISGKGCELTLADGRSLIDGTSSWWACIHGYSHPDIIQAMEQQLHNLSHVMFGGITHQPAIELAKKLVDVTEPELNKVFFCDSGSVAVEVAIKMALQYWQGKHNSDKQQILTIKQGYHGDTFAAMSVCDPDNGMHSMFALNLTKRLFAPAPSYGFNKPVSAQDKQALEAVFEAHHHEIAAMILEPIMQAAGAMNFYSPAYLRLIRELCDKYNILLILDEIATGFGRTGKYFAYQHANIVPDLICIGKALTGGHISLAATLCTEAVAQGISQSPAGVFMHGPTFMANPLACAAACASLTLLETNEWQQQVANIGEQLIKELAPAQQYNCVKDVRVLGAIGVIELHKTVNTGVLQQRFVELGIWVRPFSRFIYLMPPYIIRSQQLSKLTQGIISVINNLEQHPIAPDSFSHG